MLKLTIEENDAGQRLDRFLRKYLKRAPLSSIYRMIRKDVKVNGKRAKEDRMLEVGDELTLYLPEEQVKELAKATAPAVKKTSRNRAMSIAPGIPVPLPLHPCFLRFIGSASSALRRVSRRPRTPANRYYQTRGQSTMKNQMLFVFLVAGARRVRR